MSGPTVTVTLDAQAVAGMLHTCDALITSFDEKGFEELAAEQRAVRLALRGALRAHGWTPLGNGQWEQRISRGRR